MTNPFLHTLADLWREARSWLAAALDDFRGPAAIVRTLARDARAAIRARLALIESLVMKLLLIEAASHPFPGRREAASPGPMNTNVRERGAAKAAHRLRTAESMGPGLRAARASGNGCSEESDDPNTWRVRFHLRIPRTAHRDTLGARLTLHARPEHARAQSHARRLARRFEALRRVIADPRPAIAALARRLATFGAAARAVARRIALARPGRGASLGPTFASAMVSSHDACFSFPRDTS